MKNSKGQALVEFIIVLPIFLLLIISIVDLGNIIIKKYSLGNDLDLVVDLYNDKKYEEINNYIKKENLSIDYKNEEFLTITLKREIKITSPALIPLMGKNYNVGVSRKIYNE